MSLKLIKRLSLVIISVLILTGCSQTKPTPNQGSPANAGTEKKFTIVTSFYPMYISTINITRGIPGVQVVNMTKPQTGCLHDYQMTPEDLKTLEKADVFVINGANMEAFLDKAIKQQPKLKIIEASTGIPLLKDANGEENPHVWVSISNAILQVQNITQQLAALDSAHADQYQRNATDYIEKLSVLRDTMHKALDTVPHKDIVTFHEAFPYFAQEFKLHIVTVIEREPGTEPSPKELENTIKQIKDANIKALFAEPQYPAKAAQIIAKETGATIYTLDPAVTGDAKPEAYNDYLNIMQKNLTTLQGALQ